MPTYDYKCNGCGHVFEELQSFSAPLLTKCPACKKNKLERLFGGGGAIIFKGSGFYETDYRRSGEKKADEAPATEAKPEAKAETKPEGKAESTPKAEPAKKGGAAKKAE
ncbi:MAG TPA: zinc ribbon domain-containing protein [Urbifossiella sp.]|nr:zinc ribbon domain-containing protein [Urbifossiella sp.]